VPSVSVYEWLSVACCRTMWCAPTRDLVTLIVTVAVLAAVALVASVIPTQRATRPEPTSALRID
jgi:hypothetical protein